MKNEIIAKFSYFPIFIKICSIPIVGVISNAFNKNLLAEELYVLNTILGIFYVYMIISTIYTLFKIKTTKLSFNDKKIFGKTGIIKIISLESPINKINDIFIKQSLLGLIFNYSTIIVSTSSNRYRFEYIKNSQILRTKLLELIDKYK